MLMSIYKHPFPHPVLGFENDVLSSAFSVSCEIEKGRSEIVLNSVVNLTNETLNQMIKNGDACYVCEVICKSTFFRKHFTFSEDNIKIPILASDIRDEVVVSFYIVSNRDVASYFPSGANSEYKGYTFALKKGEELAICDSYVFVAEKAYDNYSHTSSLFQIVKWDGDSVEYEFEKEKILIYLPEETINIYKNLYKHPNPEFKHIYHAVLAYPALLMALKAALSEDGDEYRQQPWFLRLEQIKKNDDKFSNVGLNKENITKLAQLYTDNPVVNTIGAFNGFLKSLED